MPLPLLWNRILPFGRRSEIEAAAYLRSLGYRIVATNFTTKGGEIDLIGWDSDILAFIEVRSRQSADRPEDSISLEKQRRIYRAAQAYIARHKLQTATYRFDVVAVNSPAKAKRTFRLYRDAFRPAMPKRS